MNADTARRTSARGLTSSGGCSTENSLHFGGSSAANGIFSTLRLQNAEDRRHRDYSARSPVFWANRPGRVAVEDQAARRGDAYVSTSLTVRGGVVAASARQSRREAAAAPAPRRQRRRRCPVQDQRQADRPSASGNRFMVEAIVQFGGFSAALSATSDSVMRTTKSMTLAKCRCAHQHRRPACRSSLHLDPGMKDEGDLTVEKLAAADRRQGGHPVTAVSHARLVARLPKPCRRSGRRFPGHGVGEIR